MINIKNISILGLGIILFYLLFASSDIKMVSDIARRMVTEWGLSDKLGL